MDSLGHTVLGPAPIIIASPEGGIGKVIQGRAANCMYRVGRYRTAMIVPVRPNI